MNDIKELESDHGEFLKNNIDVLERQLLGLKTSVGRSVISKGQATFMTAYFEIISDYIGKSLDLLDENKYREALNDLDD